MLGYPGAGKTTAAKLIAAQTHGMHIWADEHRRTHYPEPHYSEDENQKLYEKLNKQAAVALQQGQSVIYDTAFNHYTDRKKLRAIAQEAGADTVVIWVQTPREIARDRALNADQHPATRLLGNMSEAIFGRLSDKLEKPHDNENTILLDGTQLTEKYVAMQLA
jgi:hypothetical protein